jgi:hypothetical protein
MLVEGTAEARFVDGVPAPQTTITQVVDQLLLEATVMGDEMRADTEA